MRTIDAARRTTDAAGPAGAGRRRVRLAAKDREQLILDAAIELFAEHGFQARTRQLAERLGVSQSLIFRYFGTKEALIERVYQKTFLARWNPCWERMLCDESLPLRDRLKAFYRSYLAAVDDRRWIRIAMHSSLEGNDLTRRYIQNVVADLLKVIVLQLRRVSGSAAAGEPEDDEMELVWHLHSTVIYYLIRKHIHQVPVSLASGRMIDAMVDNFLEGIPAPAAAGEVVPRSDMTRRAPVPGKRGQWRSTGTDAP